MQLNAPLLNETAFLKDTTRSHIDRTHKPNDPIPAQDLSAESYRGSCKLNGISVAPECGIQMVGNVKRIILLRLCHATEPDQLAIDLNCPSSEIKLSPMRNLTCQPCLRDHGTVGRRIRSMRNQFGL